MNLEEQYHAAAMLRKIERVEAERNNAWAELREIRAAISANPEESTLDEVVKLRQQLAEAQAEALEQARIIGMGGEREIELRQWVALLRDTLQLYIDEHEDSRTRVIGRRWPAPLRFITLLKKLFTKLKEKSHGSRSHDRT